MDPTRPHLGGPKYKFRDQDSPVALQKKIFDAIDLHDSVLMRGLSCLVKYSMLSLHYHFFEAAIYMLYVSLDASFGLVMRTLRANGIGSPSAYDAGICV
jgi:hypothetical protein